MHPALKFCDTLKKSGTTRLAISGNQPGILVAKNKIQENHGKSAFPWLTLFYWAKWMASPSSTFAAFLRPKPKRLRVGRNIYTRTNPTPLRSSGTPNHQTSRRNRPSKNLEPQLQTMFFNGAKCVPDELRNLWFSNLKDVKNAYFQTSWTSSRATWWWHEMHIKYANNLQTPIALCRIVCPLRLRTLLSTNLQKSYCTSQPIPGTCTLSLQSVGNPDSLMAYCSFTCFWHHNSTKFSIWIKICASLPKHSAPCRTVLSRWMLGPCKRATQWKSRSHKHLNLWSCIKQHESHESPHLLIAMSSCWEVTLLLSGGGKDKRHLPRIGVQLRCSMYQSQPNFKETFQKNNHLHYWIYWITGSSFWI